MALDRCTDFTMIMCLVGEVLVKSYYFMEGAG